MASVQTLEVEPRHNGERLLRLLQKHHPDYHPIVNIARIAHMAEADPDRQDLALRAHATVLKYVEPELKSIEVKDGFRDRRTINVSLFEEAEIVEETARVVAEERSPQAEVNLIEAELVTDD